MSPSLSTGVTSAASFLLLQLLRQTAAGRQ